MRRTVAFIAAMLALAPFPVHADDGFRAQGGNIVCETGGGDLTCDAYDYGRFDLTTRGRGTVELFGVNGTPNGGPAGGPPYLILSGGRFWRHGGFWCGGKEFGVICANRFGHGFLISDKDHRVF